MAAVVEPAANFRAFADFRCILIEVLESAPAQALFFENGFFRPFCVRILWVATIRLTISVSPGPVK